MDSTFKKFTVRCTAEREHVIREAALVMQKSMHTFIADEAYETARRVLLVHELMSSNQLVDSWEEYTTFLRISAAREKAERKLRENRIAGEQGRKNSASVL